MSWNGSATGSTYGNATATLNGVAVPTGIPGDASTVTLQSKLVKKHSPSSATASIDSCTATYTLTWYPNNGNATLDPPPDWAVVKATVAYNAWYTVMTDGVGTVHGKVVLHANSSIDGASPTVDNPVSVSHDETQTGDCVCVQRDTGNASAPTYFIVQPVDGTIEVTVHMDLTAEASMSGHWSYTDNYAQVSVTPSVMATPVTVCLQGSTQDQGDGSRNILIGQGSMAVLGAYPYISTDHQWSIPADAFKAYEAHSSESGGFARVTYFEPDDLTMPTVPFYCRDGDEYTGKLRTVSVTATLWDGTLQIGSVSTHSDLKVWQPYYSCVNTRNDVHECSYLAGQYVIAGMMPPNTPANRGIVWNGTALTYAPFPEAQGQWSWVQLVQSDSWSRQGILGGLSFHWYHWSTNDIVGLDTRYPAYPYTGMPEPPGDGLHQDDPNAGYACDGNGQMEGDAPYYPLLDGWTALTVDDSFQTYMMFRPPDGGCGHCWVSLNADVWHWDPYVSRPDADYGTSWIIPLPPANDLGPVTCLGNIRYTTHPEWDQVLTADDGWAW